MNSNKYQSPIAIGLISHISEDYEVALNNWHFYSDGTVQFGDTHRLTWLNVCKNVRQFVYDFFDKVDLNNPPEIIDINGCKSFVVIGNGTMSVTEDYEVVLNNCHFYNDGTVQFGDMSRKSWLEAYTPSCSSETEDNTASLLATLHNECDSHVY